MPPELLAAWEAKHPEEWSIHYIAKNCSEHAILSRPSGMILLWILGLIFVGTVILLITGVITKGGGLLVIPAVLVLLFVSMPLLLQLDHQGEWKAILDSLEDAVRTLDLMSCLGYSIEVIGAQTRERLVQAAISVLVAEELVDRDRGNKKVPVTRLMEEIRVLLQHNATFDKTLSLAVEFGLSDDNRRQYFIEAGRALPIPSEGRHKY